MVLEGVYVALQVFSCGKAELGNLLGRAMQLGGGRVAKRRTMSVAGARMLGDTVERDSWGRAALL